LSNIAREKGEEVYPCERSAFRRDISLIAYQSDQSLQPHTSPGRYEHTRSAIWSL
jgi:hypothetical protein